jgi:enterochelin esterase-like enzyme
VLSSRRALAGLLALLWLATGLGGACVYVHRYTLYRGFATPHTPAGVHRGRIEDVAFTSHVVTRGTRYLVYLPPRYDAAAARGKRFPVLYLLHGYPGNYRVFVNVANTTVDADVLLARHRIRPMIIVMPAGDQGTLRGDTEWANTPAGRWMDFIVEVVHDVDRRFATIPDRAHRVLAGDSEGAYGAVNIALHHLRLFGGLQSWGGYFTQEPTGPFRGATFADLRANSPAAYVGALAPAIRRLGLRAWLYQGRSDRADPARMYSFAAALRRAGAAVHVRMFAGGHDWGLFRAQMPRMLVAASRWFAHPVGRRARPARTRTAASRG